MMLRSEPRITAIHEGQLRLRSLEPVTVYAGDTPVVVETLPHGVVAFHAEPGVAYVLRQTP